MRCESTVAVDVPPEEVFPWLLDADKVPRWMTRLHEYQPLDPPPLAPGSRIRQTLSVNGRPLGFELRVIELDPPRRAVLRLEGSGFEAANEYSVAAAEGGSRVTWVIEGEPTSFKARLIASIVEKKLQERIDTDLARLRALLAGETAA